MNTPDPTPFEFVRAVFKPGGREYTYKAKPDTLAVGDEAVSPNGKTVMITAVKVEGVTVNGLPLADSFYGWVERKGMEPSINTTAPPITMEKT